MAPSPQGFDLGTYNKEVRERTRVVISGMSGIFPKSRNIKELSEILYDQKNPVTSDDCRWKFKHPEGSDFSGKLPSIDRFDAQFFKVHFRQAHAMDPMARMILEQSYQAIYDAGINPGHLKNKKVGVFVASSIAENENFGLFDSSSKKGFGITGSSKTMFSNRISYWLDVKGPSLTYDVDSSGSYEVLNQAYDAILRGECEAAIVGGVHLCMFPHTMVHAKRCFAIAPDGKTKSFDKNADGCARSEAISVLYLQKATDALRVYGEVVYVKSDSISKLSCPTGQVLGYLRDPNATAEFLQQFYKEAHVAPQTVEFVEAFGSATPEADKAELQAIEKVFCGKRDEALLVGSVISNIGNTDSASGLTAITKVLLGFHNGKIAANLHCENPRQDVDALREGRMKIIKQHEPTKHGYAAVNGMSVAGINSHVLLRGHFKPKDLTLYQSPLPRLVTLTARQDTYLIEIFDDLKSHPIDPEQLALLHNIHTSSVAGHLGRGYIILDTDENQKTKVLNQVSEYKDDMQQPLWFVYSGMGSQWAGMGTQLMRIPIFAAAIEKCDNALRPKGVDIINILTTEDVSIYDNVLNSFVGIAAVQIGLTDVLKAVGIVPDKIIGHSVGELGCAYADGCITAEEMILSAYARGKASNYNNKLRGAMAAVGLGYKKILNLCPPEIDVACHNSSESCTISGPEQKVREFVDQLCSKGIFAKEVPCGNIAYHSRYIADAGKMLLKRMKEIIKTPKLRSDRWLSTSIPQDRWNESTCKYCSAEYMTNNLLNSVLFEETAQHIPSNAILVEIAPHGLLQAILKRSLKNCIHIPLTRRGHSDNVGFLLNAIGQLFIQGFYPDVKALYPKVEFPVSTGTPHLSHLVRWMHAESWGVVCMYESGDALKSASARFRITFHDDEHSYLKGHIIHGRICYPFAGALICVWDTLAMSEGLKRKRCSVQFRDVSFYAQPILHENRQVELEVSLHRINGRFEVLSGMSRVASGFISLIESSEQRDVKHRSESCDSTNIGAEEIYEQLSMQGYSYKDEFQSIYSANRELTKASLLWNNNWVTLLDGLIQFNVLNQKYGGVCKPSRIRNIWIDVLVHGAQSKSMSPDIAVIDAQLDKINDTTTCGGIAIQNIQFEKEPPVTPQQIIFKLHTPPDFDRDDANKDRDLNPEILMSNEKAMSLNLNNVRDLNNLHWEEIPEPTTNAKVKVHFVGVNTHHLKRATGIIPANDDGHFGTDFSGVNKYGDRIMGILNNGRISTVVEADPDMIWPIPKYWTLADAATVPLAFTQALYCMVIKYNLTKSNSVLIHGGAGALGQAALSIAFAVGCNVFTTVSDGSKKKFLLRMFPQLKETHIASSRDNSFTDMVLSATNGRGCDLVLSCIKGSLKTECLKCVAFYGVAIDTAQIELRENFDYGMFNMTRSRSYKTVDFGSLFDPRNVSEMKKIHGLISEGISQGWVRPLSRVIYAAHEAPSAFRLLAASQHRGRVLLSLRQTSPTTVHTRITCDTSNSQVIFWDGNAFGLQCVEKLISRGATNILIHSTDTTPKYQLKLRAWNKLGINVHFSFGKLVDFDDCFALIEKARKFGPLQGIYIASNSQFAKNISNILSQSITPITKLCPTLKYSAVIAVYDKMESKSNISHIKNIVPSTVISLPSFEKVSSELDTSVDIGTWVTAALDAIEQAICSGCPIAHLHPELMQRTPAILQVARILGADKGNTFLKENLTLEEMKIQPIMLDVIGKCLERTLQVSLSDDVLQTLNRDIISQMENTALGAAIEEEKGLKSIFSYVDSDEMRSTVDFVMMDTLVADTATMGQELDVNVSYMCVIPGLEGHYERFRALCERLKMPALVLQPGLDYPNETPAQLAQRYSKVLSDKMGIKNRFIFLGYEAGVEVALELAAIFEAKGLTGTVFCIGDEPERIREHIEEILTAYPTEEALKLGVVQHMFSLMSGGTQLEETTLKGVDLDQKVDMLRRELKCVSQTSQYVRATINAAYSRLVNFRTSGLLPSALQSKIILLRTLTLSKQSPRVLENPSAPLVVYDLAVPLAHALQDLRCAAIINRHLPKDILDNFETSNLCTSYNLEAKWKH